MPNVRVYIDIPTASGRRKGWWKHVSGVNRTAKGGYAVSGEFLDEGQVDLPVGAVLVRCSPEGSVKNGWKAARVYIMQPDGLQVVRGDGCDRDGDFDLWKETPALLDTIEQALDLRPQDTSNPLAGFTVEELRAELETRGYQVSMEFLG
jgi:hypothetical protein